MEWNCFTKTSIGYSHVKNGKPCQDFSARYQDVERCIITACDGHGGSMYVRSQLGSKFASLAIMKVFSQLNGSMFRRYGDSEIAEKVKLNILCEWNAMVERSISEEPIRRKETRHLSEQDEFQLKVNGAKAYGTTLNGAMVLGDKLVCASLGDGGLFIVKNGCVYPAFDDADEEETVANITHSMCQEDAFKHLKTGIFDVAGIDGVIACTDGLINPYANLENFNRSFVEPVIKLAKEEKYERIGEFVTRLGTQIGIGDDVSLGIILKRESAE